MRRYVTCDVFTDQLFGGNPLAVVLDAEDLTTGQMQAVAREFNYSETTFVLPPKDPAHTAQVRIFTPEGELPFAGHPNVGTAWVLAREASRRGEATPARFLFEEEAGLVPVSASPGGGFELMAPSMLKVGDPTSAETAAGLLGLVAGDVVGSPRTASVGLGFLMVELVSSQALGRVKPSADYGGPHGGAIFAFTRDASRGFDLQARMFMNPAVEDPATGSAAAACVAYLCDGEALSLRIGQGIEMGRPSLLLARAERQADGVRGFVGGGCVAMFEGLLPAL